MTLPLEPIFIAVWYHFAVAVFHAFPQDGVPLGTGRYPMGRAELKPELIVYPPTKPCGPRSKSQFKLKSSMVVFVPPAEMNGLKFLPSKKRFAPAPVW